MVIEASRHTDNFGSVFVSSTIMGLIAYTGILLGLAALVHLLGRRFATGPDAR